jgi:hypothetical protein
MIITLIILEAAVTQEVTKGRILVYGDDNPTVIARKAQKVEIESKYHKVHLITQSALYVTFDYVSENALLKTYLQYSWLGEHFYVFLTTVMRSIEQNEYTPE